MRVRNAAVSSILALTAIVGTAPPAAAQVRCHPDFTAVCRVIVTICDAIDRPCAV